jgi:uncharacterized PurR-regulated membrane protein YhhQ (DUF165 family)
VGGRLGTRVDCRLLSQALDTVLFITIAFYGVVDPGSGQEMPIVTS